MAEGLKAKDLEKSLCRGFKSLFLYLKMYLNIIFLPFISSIISVFFGRFLWFEGILMIITSCLFVSFLISIFIFYAIVFIGCFSYVKLFTWLNSEVFLEFLRKPMNYGWLVGYIHANGLSLFFIIVYAHLLRGVYCSYDIPSIVLRWVLFVIDNIFTFRYSIIDLVLLFLRVKISVTIGWRRFKKFIQSILYFVKFVLHTLMYFIKISIVLCVLFIIDTCLQCKNLHSKDRNSDIYFYLCEYIDFWISTSSILGRLRGFFNMLEGNGNIHILFSFIFGLEKDFFNTISDNNLEKNYITVGFLAINVRLLGIFNTRLEAHVIGIFRNKEMWEVYLYKLLIILLKDILSNIGRYRSNSLYIDRDINDRFLRDALCCLIDLNKAYDHPIPYALIISNYSPIYFWVDWFFCVYISIFYIAGSFFKVLQAIQTFCFYCFIYNLMYFVYLTFVGWLYAVVFLLVTL